jgi:predicted histone-like DNA-binding protein
MEINYEIHTIANSQGTGRERAYIQLRSKSAMTAEQLEKEIQSVCSLTSSDVKAVMSEISQIAIRELSNGNRFYLPEIGYLSLSVGNTPISQKANNKITGKDIFLRNINFRPEAKFLNKVKKNVSFTKFPHSTLSTVYTAEELWGKTEDYLAQHRYITRQTMCTLFGLSEYKAKQWIAQFLKEGKLVKEGTERHPLYFPA